MKLTGAGVLLADWSLEGVPGGLATDGGIVYVTFGEYIRKYTSDGTFLTQWDSGTQYPHGIDIDADNNVYVSDVTNDRMMKFTTDGTLLAQWGTLGSGNGQFNNPEASPWTPQAMLRGGLGQPASRSLATFRLRHSHHVGPPQQHYR
jgi:hypothetical protein